MSKYSEKQFLEEDIPYRIMVMESIFEDWSFVINNPNLVGTFFARQEIALIKIRELYQLLTTKQQQPVANLGFYSLKKEDINPKDLKILEPLEDAAHKAVAHMVLNSGHSYENLPLKEGAKILYELLNKHWYVPRRLDLNVIMKNHRSRKSLPFMQIKTQIVEKCKTAS